MQDSAETTGKPDFEELDQLRFKDQHEQGFGADPPTAHSPVRYVPFNDLEGPIPELRKGAGPTLFLSLNRKVVLNKSASRERSSSILLQDQSEMNKHEPDLRRQHTKN
jgi:hypothetical protein